MVAQDAADGLPRIQAAWVKELLEGPIPEETLATCSNCAMLPPEGRDAGMAYFRPDTKCCTYTPRLPNFLIGALLRDDDPQLERGRQTVRQRIAEKVGVSPQGVRAPADRSLLYQRAAREGFGRSRSLRCPHYVEDGGLCGIWRYRNGVCATWHCKFVRGARGKRFWHDLKSFLVSAEAALADWCVLESDLPASALRRILDQRGEDAPASLTPADLDREPPSDYASLWGPWQGREEEWYAQCAERVEPLGLRRVLELAGAEVVLRSRLARVSYQEMVDDELPERLRIGNYSVMDTEVDSGAALLVTFNPQQPLRVSRRLLEILPMFNGMRLDLALQRIEAERGLEVPRSLVRRLVDYEVLVPADRIRTLPVVGD